MDSPAAGSVGRRLSHESSGGSSSWETLRDRFLGVKLAVRHGICRFAMIAQHNDVHVVPLVSQVNAAVSVWLPNVVVSS